MPAKYTMYSLRGAWLNRYEKVIWLNRYEKVVSILDVSKRRGIRHDGKIKLMGKDIMRMGDRELPWGMPFSKRKKVSIEKKKMHNMAIKSMSSKKCVNFSKRKRGTSTEKTNPK